MSNPQKIKATIKDYCIRCGCKTYFYSYWIDKQCFCQNCYDFKIIQILQSDMIHDHLETTVPSQYCSDCGGKLDSQIYYIGDTNPLCLICYNKKVKGIQSNYQPIGWQCPICGCGISPFVEKCNCNLKFEWKNKI